MTPLAVSVVIPAFKRPDWLVKCVRSLRDQTLDPTSFNVFVVDSSPSAENEEAMSALAREMPFALRCVRKKPEGPGPSRSLGARMSDAPFIAFLDSDCYVTPQWLEAGLAAFRDGVGIIQGRVLPDPEVPTGVFTHYIKIEKESFFYETANIFYRRQAFEESGGFPSDLTPLAETPIGGEDTEAAWSAKRLGWKTGFAADALVYHEVRPVRLWDWICIRRLFRVPGLIARFPELRQFMFGRYFYDAAQACLLLAILGCALAIRFLPGLVLAFPYVVYRAAGHTETLKGPLRIVRVAAYLLRDLTSLILLMLGSARYRALLL